MKAMYAGDYPIIVLILLVKTESVIDGNNTATY